MKKILVLLITFFSMITCINAKTIKKDFSTVINESGVDIESISISIKNIDNGEKAYSLNDKMLMNPASVQKILTTPVSLDTLGNDFEFSTEIYSRDSESFLIKLGADPYLTTSDLKKLISHVGKDSKRIYIDDSILDNKIWGEGWQWDDDMNILMPKFNSYNLDKNLIKLTIMPSDNNQFATIINPSKYPLVFFNNITTGEKTALDIHRDNTVSNNTLVLSGTIARPTTIYIPSNNLKRYFEVQLTRLLENKKIYLKENYISSKQSSKDKFEDKITHSIDFAINDILKNSNNLVSETLFKIAGAKHCSLKTGTDTAGIKMFNDYCTKNNLDNSRIRITDASGVSKNNLVSTDFITEFIRINKNNDILNKLPSPGEGTLTHRMLPIKDRLKAKTGTLSDISSIAGILTSKSNKRYAFCIIINDTKLSNSDKKMLEDYIIREAYIRL